MLFLIPIIIEKCYILICIELYKDEKLFKKTKTTADYTNSWFLTRMFSKLENKACLEILVLLSYFDRLLLRLLYAQ